MIIICKLNTRYSVNRLHWVIAGGVDNSALDYIVAFVECLQSEYSAITK